MLSLNMSNKSGKHNKMSGFNKHHLCNSSLFFPPFSFLTTILCLSDFNQTKSLCNYMYLKSPLYEGISILKKKGDMRWEVRKEDKKHLRKEGKKREEIKKSQLKTIAERCAAKLTDTTSPQSLI